MSSGSTDAPPRPADPVKPRRRRRWVWWLVASVTTVTVGVSATVVGAYVRLSGNVRHVEVGTEDLGPRPVKAATKAVNVLIVGSDQRDGRNAKYGRFPGERTDTIMLAHISPNRDNAVVVSFPRDSMVPLPACRARHGLPGQHPHVGMINESFNYGGIACTWKTVETLTGIRIDHFVKVDFTGFKDMVDAVGGVEVCVPEPVNDTKALLTLDAGRQTLRGEQALGYVRARYSLGDGSDIGRIQRQQMFIASMLKKVMSGETLTDPARLFGFLDAATRSVTTDPGLTPAVMKDLALSARGLAAGRIRFVTTPWRYSLVHPGKVEWVEPLSTKLFRIVAHDRPLTGSGVRGGQTRVPREQIDVEVRNGTWRSGLGTLVAARLEERGYHVSRIGDTARKPRPRTTVVYSPRSATKAPVLSRDLLVSAGRLVPAGTTGRLVLVIGDDWRGVRELRPDGVDGIKGFDATHDSCASA
ncbi:LCP family protein [Planomonospora parontospora]|uniref:LCP family protein n=1 Tax=Planomonospora parontospora TaxID=58119 RepID=UPI00178527AA|nr:LCP family protein [Planomonospora parontospora]